MLKLEEPADPTQTVYSSPTNQTFLRDYPHHTYLSSIPKRYSFLSLAEIVAISIQYMCVSFRQYDSCINYKYICSCNEYLNNIVCIKPQYMFLSRLPQNIAVSMRFLYAESEKTKENIVLPVGYNCILYFLEYRIPLITYVLSFIPFAGNNVLCEFYSHNIWCQECVTVSKDRWRQRHNL